MATDLTIRCACGALTGVARGLSPKAGNRLACYCDDCQAFARFLGRADTVLDPCGGTDVFQTSPARVAFGCGADRLACVRLTPKGLLRWYADCCRTPIGNTPARPGLPFVGLVHACLGAATDGTPRDAVLGPVRGQVFLRFARGDVRTLGPVKGGVLRHVPRVAKVIVGARLRGDHKRTPFFDPATGAPAVTPLVLGEAERAAVAGG